jgi:hypothetical protein
VLEHQFVADRREDDAGDDAAVAPVMRIDSPSAMMTNKLQRSAMCAPSTFQSAVVERPRPGT